MIVSLGGSDTVRGWRRALFEEMVHPMGSGENQKKQQQKSGIQTQAAPGRKLFSSAYHRVTGNPKTSCPAVQA